MAQINNPRRVVENFVINAVQAAAADLNLNGGRFWLDNTAAVAGNLSNKVTISALHPDVNEAYNYKAYTAAGTAQVSAIVIAAPSGGWTAGQNYVALLYKASALGYDNGGVVETNEALDNVESYSFVAPASPTDALCAAALKTTIDAAIAAGTSSLASCTRSTATLTLTAGSALFTFALQPFGPDFITTQTNSASCIPPSLTYTQINALFPSPIVSASSSGTFARYKFHTMIPDVNTAQGSDGRTMILCETNWFVNTADADFGDLDTAIVSMLAGSATAAGYLGIN